MYLSIRRSRGNNNNHIIIERCLIAYLVCMPVHTSPDNAERSFPYNFMDFVNIIEEDFLLIRHFFWGLEPWSQLGCCPLSCLQPTKLRSILHILHILLHVLHSNLVLKSSYWFGFHSCWWTVMRIKFNTNSLWKIKKERTEQGIIFPVGVFFTLWLDPVGSLWFVRRYYAYFLFLKYPQEARKKIPPWRTLCSSPPRALWHSRCVGCFDSTHTDLCRCTPHWFLLRHTNIQHTHQLIGRNCHHTALHHHWHTISLSPWIWKEKMLR